jgi:hypothetical protein
MKQGKNLNDVASYDGIAAHALRALFYLFLLYLSLSFSLNLDVNWWQSKIVEMLHHVVGDAFASELRLFVMNRHPKRR